MEINFFGGKDEIGGNKILVEHKGTKIMLDFGMSFKQAGKYFSEFLQPRKAVALTDFFELGLLPEIKGIYREDYLKHMGRPTEERGVDAVFLSHAHADHAPYIHFLRKDIPIHCTKATKIIMKVLEETGSSSFSDFVTGCEAYTFYKNTKGEMSRVTSRNKEYVYDRPFNIMEGYQKVTIGSLIIQCVPVDHSLPGACGFIIETDDGKKIVYTGDMRFHGYHKDLSDKFVEIAKSIQPDILLCEGTRINTTKNDSEEKVCKKFTRLISKAKGLVFIEHPIRDIDRVYSVYKSAIANKREFVVTLKQAYLIRELGELCPFKLEDVKILVPQKSWGLICKDIECSLVEADYSVWEREFIHLPNSINYKELVANPLKYVVSMNMWEINQLVDIKPTDAIWIKSSCEPFSDEMEIDEGRKKNWLKHFKIKHYHAHASGHMPGADIKRVVAEINAKKLIPIHTEHREMF